MKRSDKKPKPVPIQPVEDQNVYQVRMAEWLKAFGEAFGFEPNDKLKKSARKLVDHSVTKVLRRPEGHPSLCPACGADSTRNDAHKPFCPGAPLA